MSALTHLLRRLERAPIRCQNCPMVFTHLIGEHSGSAPTAARAQGWVIWAGSTLGGREETKVLCPWCAGRITEPQRWNARCETCGAEASECDEYEDEPFTLEDAKRWKEDHECEPDVRLVQPTPPHREAAA
jgi:hypothetical protein